IVTENDIGGARPMDYADDFFDNNGYGLGDDHSGCLFLQVTNSRNYWFSTTGRGIQILNSTAYAKLDSDIRKFLGEGDAYGAYRAFLQNWEVFLSLDARGRSYNFFYRWNVILVSISWLLALGVGFLVVQTWKRGMDTARLKTQAASYIVPGSLAFREKKDRFLYSTVSKREKPRQPTGGGGSGIHTGSSGRSHGGGGGRY
ncbi:MAG: TPM domain-containing protein, partial [Treponema sp.]|nr:TPM domain-containing protein [Treponema sp.]